MDPPFVSRKGGWDYAMPKIVQIIVLADCFPFLRSYGKLLRTLLQLHFQGRQNFEKALQNRTWSNPTFS